MLLILSGDIQTGKTRWLERCEVDLAACGVSVEGVIAPGEWLEHPELDGDARYEKIGIDNRLLPQGELVRFAVRRDLAMKPHRVELGLPYGFDALRFPDLSSDMTGSPRSVASIGNDLGEKDLVVSGAVGEGSILGGRQHPAAFPAPVDSRKMGWSFFDEAIARVDAHFAHLAALADIPKPGGSLLVVDELGRLELLMDEGLTHAVELVGRGPTRRYPHMVIVVRDGLADRAEQRFSAAWRGEVCRIAPDAQGRALLLGLART